MLYMQHLADMSASKATVEEAFNAVAWIHSMSGQTSPTETQLVKTLLQGLQRKLAKPTKKKQLMTPDILEAIVDNAYQSASLADLRLATACLLGYAGFMRFDELIQI